GQFGRRRDRFGKDKKTGKNVILNATDLDGRASLGFLKLAGINTENIEYVAPGKFIEGRINLDTGDRHGIVVEDEGKTAFFDHHTDKSGRESSATKFTYQALTNLGLLKGNPVFEKLVEFVNQVDNRNYPEEEKYFKDSYRTVLGLQKSVPFGKLLVFFRSNKKAHEILTDKELEEFGLEKESRRQKNVVEQSMKRLEEMEKEGLIVDAENYGKIAVDINKTIRGGFDAAKAHGCGGYIIWNPKENSFFLTTINSLVKDFNLSQGKRIRETMWIKPRNDNKPLDISLGEIINKLTNDKFSASGELKNYLDKENFGKEFEWIMKLSENIEEQEKIKALFGRILEMARKVDAYQGLPEESLKTIAVNKTKENFIKYK
ncbi:MAG: hypothetical protein AAB948_00080, partial [Patescibacteria group bacterium]